jgi:hypothetical protein
LTFTLIEGRIIVLKKVNKGYMPKSLHDICAFPYYALHVIMMDFFKLWLLVVEYICFQHFNFIRYINYLGKDSYHMLLETLLRFDYHLPLQKFFEIILILLLIWSYFVKFLIGCLKVHVFMFTMPNCTNDYFSSFWNVPYLCKYIFALHLLTYTHMLCIK